MKYLVIIIFSVVYSTQLLAVEKACEGNIFAVSETELYIDSSKVRKNTLAEGTYFRYDPWYFDHIGDYINPQFVGIKAEFVKSPSLIISIVQGKNIVHTYKAIVAGGATYKALLENQQTQFQVFRTPKTLFEMASNFGREKIKLVLTVADGDKKYCSNTYEVVIDSHKHAH